MSNYQIHETVIRDVIDLISDIKKSDEVNLIKNRDRSFSSIAKASDKLTLVFPVLVSKNMNIESAGMVTKAIERKATTMLQMLFSAINISDAKNGVDYIKNFHTNLKVDGVITVDNFIEVMDDFVASNESAMSYDNKVLYEKVKIDLKNINYFLSDSINEQSLNDYKVYPQSILGEATIMKEAKLKVGSSSHSEKWKETLPNADAYGIMTTVDKSDTTTTDLYTDVPDIDKSRDAVALNKDKLSMQKTSQEIIRNQILDTDVKKANELIPTMMVINYVDVETGRPIDQCMVIGVKAKMYTLDSSDILNRLSLKNQDHNGLLRFIKASTREISFFKDFVFAIDRAKVDALSQSRKGSSSKLWKVLERRSTKSKIRRTMGSKNDASAISTLVVSQEEVEYLKKSENINIEDPKVIRPIMESYNLMSVCIVDETMETTKFIFDTGNDIYETLSFTLLERETSDGGYKKVINLMTKLSR